jgi:hypothetical protein
MVLLLRCSRVDSTMTGSKGSCTLSVPSNINFYLFFFGDMRVFRMSRILAI